MPMLALALITLVVCAAALWRAIAHDRRVRDERAAREAIARRRADIAAALSDSIVDPEVRAAWHIVRDALRQDWLSAPRDVDELVRRLRSGDGLQLREEVAIEIDDESPAGDRVALCHLGFVPPRLTCPRDELIRELERLSADLEGLARGSS